jgi:uracil-DNA glycosylase
MPRFNPACRLCPRINKFLDTVRKQYPDYHAGPVPPFGMDQAQLLIVGLAPGLHGANATGRPFTGDFAGILLYETLYQFGFANQVISEHVGDGLILHNCRITNAVKCVPPVNKPTGTEIINCNPYLQTELLNLPDGALILALGRIAHNAVIKALNLRQKDFPFGHGRHYDLSTALAMLDSYHCSRYNTQTGRLTVKMFQDIFYKVHEILSSTN